MNQNLSKLRSTAPSALTQRTTSESTKTKAATATAASILIGNTPLILGTYSIRTSGRSRFATWRGRVRMD